uniref:Transmembrane protein n=1 Tax=Pithovirus LCPAC304 TaxID=2506594 RepID=A0A481Z8K6_9VIRU|nr:MAG: hypothetical protein LCPAC304_01530 [Pithovirus LCPAC304]
MNEVTLASSMPSSTTPNLITSTTAGILGPIQTGESVYIGFLQSGTQQSGTQLIPWFVGEGAVDGCTTTQGMVKLWRFVAIGDLEKFVHAYRIIGTVDENDEPRIQLVNATTNAPNAPLGFILVDGKKVLAELKVGDTPPKFRLEQSTYSPWPIIEGVALSFINYKLVPEDGGSLFYCAGDECFSPDQCNTAGMIVPLPSIFFAPTTWYTDCGGAGTFITSKTTTLCSVLCAGQSLQTGPKQFACGKNPKPGGGLCFGKSLLGFTNKIDCTHNFPYEYCTVPKQCVGCRSACPSIAQVCTFQSRSNGGGVYHCLGGGGPSGPSGPSGTHCIIDLQCTKPQRCIDRSCQTTVLSKKEEQFLIIVAILVGVIVLGVILFVVFLFVKGVTTKKK